MIWVVGIGIFIALLCLFPGLRKVALYLALAAGALIGVMVGLNRYNTDTAKRLISPSQIALSDMRLAPQQYGSGHMLSGVIRNGSSHSLESLEVQITAYDCPANATHRINRSADLKSLTDDELLALYKQLSEPEQPAVTIDPSCEVVGQQDVMASVLVPPNQARSIGPDTSVYFSNLPPIKGAFRWSYEIKETVGRR